MRSASRIVRGRTLERPIPPTLGGDVACPLEDCGGDRDDILSLDSREVMVES